MDEKAKELYMLLEDLKARRKVRKINFMYPEVGPLSRFNYPKHMSFFSAGVKYRERAAMAANRVGKTEGIGGFELTNHLTGIYPEWWDGRRFTKPIKSWAAGTTNQTTKDILQEKLLGPMNDIGSGLIPKEMIVDYKRKASSVPDTIETAFIRSAAGGISTLGFKSYEQGRKAFEGVEQDVILLDEESPEDIYDECLIRTMTTNGLIMLTFTPLQGVSNVVLKFMPGGKPPSDFSETGRFLVSATWDDAPHLLDQDKKDLWAALPPHQRDARAKGIPSLGSGAIYPINEEDLLVDDFKVPDYWQHAYGMDFGWNCTAALWGAIDRETDILYLVSCYKRGHGEPPVHVEAIKSRGAWMNGVADPAGRASSQKDGEKLLDEYVALGLKLRLADNAVEAGIFDVWMRMATGKLKIFKSLTPLLEELRLYRRDKNGKVLKENDHLMDCMRYLVRSGISCMTQIPADELIGRILIKRKEAGYNPLTYGLDIGGADDNPLMFGRG